MSTYKGAMRQAIVTRYHGATDRRPGRIIASANAGRVIVKYDHALNTVDNHYAAAMALCARFGWIGPYIGGGKNGGMVWVSADE